MIYKLLTIILLTLSISTSAVLGQTGASGMTQAAVPAFWWRCPIGDSTLNYNNARIIGHGDSLVFDSLPYSEDYTMVVVYKALDTAESDIWRLEYADSTSESIRKFTTERIVSDGTSIRYAEQTSSTPVINTLRQSAPPHAEPFVRLVVGGGTSQGRTEVAEIMYFDRRLNNSMLRRVQSALAIRYGITLGPVNYVDGKGRQIWDYADSGMFHHRITGVGRDNTYGLNQSISRSEMDSAILSVETDSMAEKAFLVVGDNGAPLSFAEELDGVETLGRRWRVQATGVDSNRFSLTFDTRDIPSPTDSLVLMTDECLLLPSHSSPNEVRFDSVVLSDTCTFTLARGAVLWQMAKGKARRVKDMADDAGREHGGAQLVQKSVSSVFPNPTTGHYTIEVSGARDVQVTVFNVTGTVVATYSDRDKERYVFDGSLPSGSSYYATVTTEHGSQTMKIVVK